MKITESLSQFLKSPEKRNHRFRTSHYPKVYLGEEFKSKIDTIKAYYKCLDTPTDSHKKLRNSRSPVKVSQIRHLNFAFRSHSSSKLLREDINARLEKPIKLRYYRSHSKTREKISKEPKQERLLELIRISSAK
jgi:hypothetical protein